MNRRRLVLFVMLAHSLRIIAGIVQAAGSNPSRFRCYRDSTSVAANSTATSAPTVEPTATESVETASLADVPGYRAEFTSEYSMGEEGL